MNIKEAIELALIQDREIALPILSPYEEPDQMKKYKFRIKPSIDELELLEMNGSRVSEEVFLSTRELIRGDWIVV